MTGALADRRLTYSPVGLTTADNWRDAASGFRISEQRTRLGAGPDRWSFAAEVILRWGVKTRSGFTVEAPSGEETDELVEVGDRRWLVAHLGPLKVREPIEVVTVIDEPDRKGFAYGTLTGHPLSGEEAFVLDRTPDESVWLTVRSITQPQSSPWRWA